MAKRTPVLGAMLLLMGACLGSSESPRQAVRVIVIGVDGMDPGFIRRHRDALPTLGSMIAGGQYRDLQTTVPPQSPVAWSTVITGENPGSHGIYDFIHRDPATLRPFSSMSETIGGDRSFRLGKYRIPLTSATSRALRKGTPFWERLTSAGIPVTITRMPTNFPPTDDGSRGLSGMGTPDMLGTFGTFSYYTDDPVETRTRVPGGRIFEVQADSQRRITTQLHGPINDRLVVETRSATEMIIDLDPATPVVRVQIGDEVRVMEVGDWSNWIPVDFPLIPLVESARGMVRLHLAEVRPVFRLYVSPVNVDPMDPALPIAKPAGSSREMATAVGRFYTQGMPVDTKAYSAGVLSRAALVEQANIVLTESASLFDYQLRAHDEGLLFFYFSVVDQMSHMLWGRHDEELLGFYESMDEVLAQALEVVGEDTQVIIMSDHGFASFERKFNLNAWLAAEGFLAVSDPARVDDPALLAVDWTQTRAYGLGFNGLYLNMAGREKQGIVASDQRAALIGELTTRLLEIVDPGTGETVIENVYDPRELFGEIGASAPDLIVGYAPPYRGSDETALGRIGSDVISQNRGKWIGDHCMSSDRVPGVLFSNATITRDRPGLADVPLMILEAFELGTTGEERGFH